MICLDDCRDSRDPKINNGNGHALNGECQDGGANSTESICTFGHDAPLPAMSVDGLPAPPKKGLFDQLLDNLPLPLDRQLVNAAKAVQASLESR